jgi:hypothetical protein
MRFYLVYHHTRFSSQGAFISGSLIQFKSLNQIMFSIKIKLKKLNDTQQLQ